jgi:methylase of polypeptide subunit release factors
MIHGEFALSETAVSTSIVSWLENGTTNSAQWHSESNATPPKKINLADDTTNSKVAYKQVCEGASLIYRGDFQNAKQLLQAIARKVDANPTPVAENLTQAFHQHRARQIQRANITNKILIELRHGSCDLKRAPDLTAAVVSALSTDTRPDKLPAKMLISLRELLGIIGAHEWDKKGVFIESLQANIHATYGVYSPLRGEYLSLIQSATLGQVKTAFDIGTGTGVIAAILATRGVKSIIATDNSERAIHCAAENIARLNLKSAITLEQANLFPGGNKRADLIVCNPPWLPAKANAPIEHAIYDPNSAMLRGFLGHAKEYLNADGEVWLVLSDIAEHLGLRSHDELHQWIASGGLTVIEKLDTAPKHSKSSDVSDPLYAARVKEVTSLYRLK